MPAGPESGTSGHRALLARVGIPVGLGVLGIVLVVHPMLWGGVSRVPGWPEQDPRLIAFVFEHAYRWLAGFPEHASLWSPPIFFPQSGAATYTEPLVAAGLLYWPWRSLGCSPLTAYQLWVVSIFALNYASALVLLRWSFDTSRPAAAVGAFVFAFGSSRIVSLSKSQLIPYFYLVLALLALLEVFRVPPRTGARVKSWMWIGVFAAALVAQFYTAFYPFYFFGLALLVALAWASCVPSLRRAAWPTIRRNGFAIAACGTLALLAIAPLATAYILTAGEVGLRPYDSTKITQWFSWSLMGSSNWLYGWVDRLPRFSPWSRSIHNNGLGLVTVVVAAVGLYRARTRQSVVVIVLTAATLFVISLRLYDDVSLWWWVRGVIPGSEALRAVARIGNLLVFPVAIGLALFFEQQARRTSPWLLALLAGFCVAEQLHRDLSFDKAFLEWRVARIAAEVPAGCKAFFLVTTGGNSDIDVHDDAMWVSLATGIPTVNGRSGNVPPGWELQDSHLQSAEERHELEARLARWLVSHELARDDVCWVEIDRTRERAEWRDRARPKV